MPQQTTRSLCFSSPAVVSFLLFLLAAFFLAPSHRVQGAEGQAMPRASRLLPQDTMAYISLDNADDLRETLAESSLGLMLADEKLRPFASDVYGTMTELFDMVSQQIGVSLDQLLAIPKGQVALALIPRKAIDQASGSSPVGGEESKEELRRRLDENRRREHRFAAVLLVEAGNNANDLLAIIERMEDRLLSGTYVRRTTIVDSVEIVRLLPQRPGREEIEYFDHDGSVVLGFGHRAAQDVWDHWRGASQEPTLADSPDFGAIISRCIGAESTRPQVTFYVDPYHIAERGVRLSGSLAAGLMWPLFENLGLARIRGLGGSSFRGSETFSDIVHLHILIDPPRDGLLGVLRPSQGETSPPHWVPADVTGYSSIHWDFKNTYTNLGKILEDFQGADALQRLIEAPTKKRTGINIREDVLENLTGRIVRMSWMEPPVRLNSQVQVNALELSDSTAIESVIADYRQRQPNSLQVETIGGKVVYFTQFNPQRFPDALRRPEPCIFVLENWLIQTDSRQLVERLLRAQGDALPRLINVPEYDLIASELGGKLDGESPFLVHFLRGSEFIRQFYELTKSPDSRGFLRQASENNVIARKMLELLERNELPPYEQFEKYFAPSGSFAYDEPTGLHLGAFTLRADE